jgi:hypothetical protein
MAKSDKQEVARAKTAAAKARKTREVRVNKTRTAMTSPKGGRKLNSSKAKEFNKMGRQGIKSNPLSERGKTKDFATRSNRMVNNPKYSTKDTSALVLRMDGTPTVKGGSSSVSARKPSVPVKTGVKNKMKAQGAKSMSGPTSGYGRSTKPRGK